jgi:hypothetical protein
MRILKFLKAYLIAWKYRDYKGNWFTAQFPHIWYCKGIERYIVFCPYCGEYICEDGYCSNPFCPERIKQ